MTITALPTAPNRLDTPATFDAAVGAFLTALPTMVSEINAVLPTIDAAVVSADASESAAAASAIAAAASAAASEGAASATASIAGAVEFVSGFSYAQYACAISQITRLTYRRNTTGSGVADPSDDRDNWTCLNATAPVGAILSMYQSYGVL